MLNQNHTPGSPETISATKRTLLKLGWAVPVVVAVSLPKSGFAANVSKPAKPPKDKPPKEKK